MNELHLLNKLIRLDECPVLLKSDPSEDWEKDWMVMDGQWKYEDGWLIGAERRNRGGILFTRQSFDCDVIFSFTAKTVLPATRDVNALFCAHWNNDINCLGNAYVVGLNGWYDDKSGIERNPECYVRALTGAYKYTPGSEVKIITGIVDGHSFLYADDVLIEELVDPNSIKGGHVGFSPYCTMMAVKDMVVLKGEYIHLDQSYEPEF